MVLRKRVKYNLVGSPVSMVSQTVAEEDLLSSDCFIVSQPASIADAASECYYTSNALSYNDFAKQLSADVVAALSLGKIVHDPVQKYSLAKHEHPQYSHVEVQTFCSNRQQDVLCSLVTFETDGVSENISIPMPAQQHAYTVSSLAVGPQIGEVRLFGLQSYSLLSDANGLVTDMQSDAFSGWTIPNGTTKIDKERFPEAWKLLGDVVPYVDGNLLKMNPYNENVADSQQSNAVVEASQPIPTQLHQHSAKNGVVKYADGQQGSKVSFDFKYDISYKIWIDKSVDWSGAQIVGDCNTALEYGFYTCACQRAPMLKVKLSVASSIEGGGMETAVYPSDANLAKNPTMPSYTEVLALVYIGKPHMLQQSDETEAQNSADREYEEYIPSKEE